LHTQLMALQFHPALTGEAAPMTPAMIAHEREMAQAAKANNKAMHEAAALRLPRLPQIRTQRPRPTRQGVQAAIVQIGRADLLA
jgi:hypothetical protein